MSTLGKVLAGAVPVTAVLVALAMFLPVEMNPLLRQVILFGWGTGTILVADRLLFGTGWGRAFRAIGGVAPRARAVTVALLVSLPMWLFFPLHGAAIGMPVSVNAAWPSILLGVIVVNGIAEEAIHRGFVFGHMRKEASFLAAAGLSALIFGAQHIYLTGVLGPVAASLRSRWRCSSPSRCRSCSSRAAIRWPGR